MKNFIVIFLLFVSFGGEAFASECVVTMGYKKKAKPPYIFDDNSGIYRDIYGEALRRVGCKLKIVRHPKLRIIDMMKEGDVDFYPTFHFTLERATFATFFLSHIDHVNVLVTRADYPEIKSIADLIIHQPIILKESGGASPLDGVPARRFEQTDMNIEKAIKLLINKRFDAFSYTGKVVEYYLKLHPEVKDKVRLNRGVIHYRVKDFTLGFSILSKYVKFKPNKYFDPQKSIALDNYPTILDEDSVAYKFAKELEKMDKDGTIEKVYDKYRTP